MLTAQPQIAMIASNNPYSTMFTRTPFEFIAGGPPWGSVTDSEDSKHRA